MKLYEVNTAIMDIIDQMVDPETGEIIDLPAEALEELDALQMERSRILEYLAKQALNERAEQAALKEEEKRLAARRKRAEAKEKKLIELLDRECGGQKTDLGVATLNYRKTTSVEVADTRAAIEFLAKDHEVCLRIKEPEIAKDEVKKLIRLGVPVPGCQIVENTSCTLK